MFVSGNTLLEKPIIVSIIPFRSIKKYWNVYVRPNIYFTVLLSVVRLAWRVKYELREHTKFYNSEFGFLKPVTIS